jgi:hypothetical protein
VRRGTPPSKDTFAYNTFHQFDGIGKDPPFDFRRVDFFVPAQAPKRLHASHLSDSVNFPIFNSPAPVLNPATP